MLYSSLTTLLSASLVYFATAANVTCPIVDQQCCGAVNPANETVTAALLTCLKAAIPKNLTVGVGCVPHPFADEISCDGRLVCCSQNKFAGILSLNCTAGPF
ncbi:hypothetical protein BD779DRAFT_1674832 [Infundibulicybe gibba]|nr:hypothetical protein BD779DRAFT_1674832 [Infundibulicybe gibba]